MLSITLLLQVPQTIPVRYVFAFVREIITCRTHSFAFTSSCAVMSPLVLLRHFPVRHFQSVIFQSCKFSYPLVMSTVMTLMRETLNNIEKHRSVICNKTRPSYGLASVASLGGLPWVTPSRGWHPTEIKNVAEFRKNTRQTTSEGASGDETTAKNVITLHMRI